jgi:hypothetical protein
VGGWVREWVPALSDTSFILEIREGGGRNMCTKKVVSHRTLIPFNNETGSLFQNGRRWYESVCIYHTLDSLDLTVVAWIGGQGAVVMETLPESEVKDVLHEMLTLFLGLPDLPRPARFIRYA